MSVTMAMMMACVVVVMGVHVILRVVLRLFQSTLEKHQPGGAHRDDGQGGQQEFLSRWFQSTPSFLGRETMRTATITIRMLASVITTSAMFMPSGAPTAVRSPIRALDNAI